MSGKPAAGGSWKEDDFFKKSNLPRPYRRSVIISKVPGNASDYPHPQCILGGWESLLDKEYKASVFKKEQELQGLDDAAWMKVMESERTLILYKNLDTEKREMVARCLKENKAWEKSYGPIWFDTPPHPECIFSGWETLLDDKYKASVFNMEQERLKLDDSQWEKVMQHSLNRHSILYNCIDGEKFVLVAKCLEEMREWERMVGVRPSE